MGADGCTQGQSTASNGTEHHSTAPASTCGSAFPQVRVGAASCFTPKRSLVRSQYRPPWMCPGREPVAGSAGNGLPRCCPLNWEQIGSRRFGLGVRPPSAAGRRYWLRARPGPPADRGAGRTATGTRVTNWRPATAQRCDWWPSVRWAAHSPVHIARSSTQPSVLCRDFANHFDAFLDAKSSRTSRSIAVHARRHYASMISGGTS
jgi:hypothetical protein